MARMKSGMRVLRAVARVAALGQPISHRRIGGRIRACFDQLESATHHDLSPRRLDPTGGGKLQLASLCGSDRRCVSRFAMPAELANAESMRALRAARDTGLSR